MATFADEFEDSERRSTRAPVSAHPAFPAVVALWFAALLGLGSLILPVVLLERLTNVTGIDSIIPAAAAPLGFTARATIALAAALAGAALGLLLAVQIAKGQAPKPRPRFSGGEARECRPISAHEELGQDGLGDRASRIQSQKRRTLAITEESSASDYMISVPVPGHDWREEAPPIEEALELGEFAEPDEANFEQDTQDDPMADNEIAGPAFEVTDEDTGEQEFSQSSAQRPTGLPRALDPVPDDLLDDDLEAEGDAVDALPFAPPSLRRTAEVTADNDIVDADELEVEVDEFEDEPAPLTAAAVSLVKTEPSFEEPAASDRPLDELGLVQLATRLGQAIEQRRAQRASSVSPEPHAVFASCDVDFDAAAEADAAQARAEFFGGASMAQSQPVQPVDFPEEAVDAPGSGFEPSTSDHDDEPEDDDFAASFSLPLNHLSAQTTSTPTVSDDECADDEDVAGEEEYSSLLAMRNPFERKDEFVRVEIPEDDDEDFAATVTFPEVGPIEGGSTPRPFDPPAGAQDARPMGSARNPADAERELRAALETLQRMSGAA